jgi:hypothetical protein
MSSNRKKLREDFKEETGYEWHPWRWAAGILGAVITVWLIFGLLDIVSLPFRTGHGVAKKISNPNNVIFTYEHFHDLCGGIVGLDQQYATAAKEAAAFDKRTDGKADPLGRNAEESARLHQDAAGIKLARQQQAQTYNADSRKFTQNHFKSSRLPYRIEDGVTPDCDGQTTTP